MKIAETGNKNKQDWMFCVTNYALQLHEVRYNALILKGTIDTQRDHGKRVENSQNALSTGRFFCFYSNRPAYENTAFASGTH